MLGVPNMHGEKERDIQEIKSFNTNISNQNFSVIQWETIASKVAKCINDLPLVSFTKISEFKSLDPITPN